MTTLSLAELDQLTRGRLGTHDVPCPLCGPDRRSAANRRRPVLRVWRDLGWAGFHCARCGARGSARDHAAPRIDSRKVRRIRAEAARRGEDHARGQLSKARWLWRSAVPASGTIAQTYLRSRGILTSPPGTVRFLRPRKPGQHPAMVCAFGDADEPAPGELTISEDRITGVHLTLLKPDGSGKAEVEPSKIMVGPSLGSPIVWAPPNDLLGLGITEGLEDAATVHQETGLGAWAGGAAGCMPALADAVPYFIEAATIYAHEDEAGQRGAEELAHRLDHRGIEVFAEGLAR